MSGHQRHSVSADEVTLPANSLWNRAPVIGGVLGLLGLAATWGLSGTDHKQFYFSYLVAFLFFLTIALGGLFFVIVQFATRSGWSVVVRRTAENLMIALPLFAALFLVVVLGMHELYHWSHHDAVQNDPVLLGKHGYLNEGFFKLRAIFYFVVWTVLALYFRHKSVAQDSSGDHDLTRKMQKRSFPAIIFFALSVTFAAFDWSMSLDPHWFSTIFGVIFFSGCVIAGLASMILILLGLTRNGGMKDIVTTEHFHDMGKLMFGFMVFWTYTSFSQYFLIWYANIPEETLWFAHRSEGSWAAVSKFLAVGHFALPFAFLLSRHVKRNRLMLGLGAAWMLFIHYVDLFWQVMPTLHPHGAHFGLVDVAALVGVGGLFLAVVSFFMKKNLLVPARDPRLPESLAFENL